MSEQCTDSGPIVRSVILGQFGTLQSGVEPSTGRWLYADNRGMPADLQSILKLEVPIIVQIAGRMMPAEDVLALGPGAIMELPKDSDEELEILINNKPIGLGRAVKVGENFGIRVTYVGDLRKRVAALAANSPSAEGSEPEPVGPETEALADQILAGQ